VKLSLNPGERHVEKWKGIDVLISIYFYVKEIVYGGKMRNEMLGFPRFRRIAHVGFYLLDASREWLAFGVIRM
jgi:hypothetical protein